MHCSHPAVLCPMIHDCKSQENSDEEWESVFGIETGECWEDDCGEILEERWGKDKCCSGDEEWESIFGIIADAKGAAEDSCVVLLLCKIQKKNGQTDTNSNVNDGEENNSE